MSTKKDMPYINREISWLSFNERVLQEAADKSVPLIERLKFLGIFSNNRDEFYRVRVATVKRLSKLGKKALAFYDEDPSELLTRLQRKVIQQQISFEEIYNELKIELAENNVYIINEKELKQNQQEYIREYFTQVVSSTLFPLMIDDQKDFPYMKDKASYMYLKLESILNKQKNKYALIEIPSKIISRFVRLPDQGNKKFIILLDDVIRFNTDQIFDIFGYRTLEAYNIKLTRDAELDIDSDLSKSMLEKISKSLKARKKGLPVRFVYDAAMSTEMLRYIMKKLGMATKDNAIPGGRYHNFKDFINFPNLGDRKLVYNHPPELLHKYLANKPFTTLRVIKERDILLHYPYHSYNHIINLLREASIDPIVQSIKITLYRVADSSKIANALINAVKNGKQVTVLVELQARFDEEHNIYWANKLKDEGANVIYGVPGLKVHSKCILISTIEKGRTYYYAHVGTGNFNEKTARVYTDFSLLTADKLITDDLVKLFEFYENNFKIYEFKQLLVAPFYMRTELTRLIQHEITAAKAKRASGITLKLNSLVDKQMIGLLYEANMAGVPIKLIIRGACSLVTDLPGWSEGIKAYSIVDKYLEHTRVFIFHNGGNEKIFLSSADWMSRNLDSRSEVAIPIRDPLIRKQIKEIMDIQLRGNTKVRIIDRKQDNVYKKAGKGERKIRVQDEIYNYLKNETTEFLKEKK